MPISNRMRFDLVRPDAYDEWVLNFGCRPPFCPWCRRPVDYIEVDRFIDPFEFDRAERPRLWRPQYEFTIQCHREYLRYRCSESAIDGGLGDYLSVEFAQKCRPPRTYEAMMRPDPRARSELMPPPVPPNSFQRDRARSFQEALRGGRSRTDQDIVDAIARTGIDPSIAKTVAEVAAAQSAEVDDLVESVARMSQQIAGSAVSSSVLAGAPAQIRAIEAISKMFGGAWKLQDRAPLDMDASRQVEVEEPKEDPSALRFSLLDLREEPIRGRSRG